MNTGLHSTKMTLTLLVILMSMASLHEGKSIPSNVDLSWLPKEMSLEDWDRCYGLPCDQQQVVRTKLHELQALTLEEENIDDDNIAFDITHQDGSLDGCILVSEQQLDILINETKEELVRQNSTKEEDGNEKEHSRRKRSLTNFQKFPDQKWQKHEFPIRYMFDGKHNEEQRNIIRAAIHHWEAQTCVRFGEIKGQPPTQSSSESYIVFSGANYVCHSYVGKQGRGPQPVYLAENCLWNFGIPVHEIFHVLGVWHTHMRPDRDQYVKIHNENLGYYRGQFRAIRDAIVHGIPYDYSSVMHYSPKDGTINDQIVIESKDPGYQTSMGQRVGLSFYDAMLINIEYCSDVCRGRTWRPCQRGGYQDPNNCHKCKCPDGFGGDYCENVAPSTPGASCGGVLNLPKYMRRIISTPNYDAGVKHHYFDYTECNWLIRVPTGWNVVFRFIDKFGLLVHNQGECAHWVEVKYKTDKQRNGPRFCGSETPTEVLSSEDQEMVVIFKSNQSSSNHRANTGFKALISLVPAVLFRPGAKKPAVPPVQVHRPAPEPQTQSPQQRPTTTETTTTATTTTTREPQRHIPLPNDQDIDNFLWYCNFETSDNRQTWCNITQEREYDQFDWEITSGQTDSDMTGPDYAFNGANYVYIEASKPRVPEDKAVLRLPRFGRSGEHCLSWRYYMYGHHINTLKIVVEGDGRYDVLWARTGEQKPVQWLSAHVTVNLTPWARILFIGSRGLEYSGDIAMDAISLLSGPCWTETS